MAGVRSVKGKEVAGKRHFFEGGWGACDNLTSPSLMSDSAVILQYILEIGLLSPSTLPISTY